MRKIIDHYIKLLPCDQFIITGSFGWMQLGLMNSAKDLDIILVNPTEESLSALGRLREPKKNPDYPDDPNHFIVKHGDTVVDFFISKRKQEVIALANGLFISAIKDTVSAKKKFARFKDFIQLKNVSEIFYKQSDFLSFVQDQQKKYSDTPVSAYLPKAAPAKKKAVDDDDLD